MVSCTKVEETDAGSVPPQGPESESKNDNGLEPTEITPEILHFFEEEHTSTYSPPLTSVILCMRICVAYLHVVSSPDCPSAIDSLASKERFFGRLT